jgi:hypothetical protein
VALLAHLRLYPGQSANAPGGKRFFLASEGPFDTDDVRFYIYAIGGHTFLYDENFGDDIEVRAPGDFNATLGGGLGANLSRHWGVEMQLVHTEPNLKRFEEGKIAELSNLTWLPSVRYRYPFLDGQLVPYALAGFGAAFNRINDRRQPQLDLDVNDMSWAATVGVGVEYFLNHHLSVGLSVPFFFYPDWDTEVITRDPAFGPVVSRVRDEMNLSGAALLLRIAAYLP